jgi:hypothetical protein
MCFCHGFFDKSSRELKGQIVSEAPDAEHVVHAKGIDNGETTILNGKGGVLVPSFCFDSPDSPDSPHNIWWPGCCRQQQAVK